MCRYCVEYGNGTKWYLNPDNYDPSKYLNPGHAVGWTNLTSAARHVFEWDGPNEAPYINMGHEMILDMAIDTMLQQAGQVVTLEEAMQIIDVAPGTSFILQHCGCRRHWGFKDEDHFYGCMFFETHERILTERPWEDNRRITKEEAREVCRDAYRKGLVISIFDCGTDSDGKFPLNFCFCNAFDCQAYKTRAYRECNIEFKKGHYVATVDPVKCSAGCKNEAPCIMKCQYGGIQYSPLRDVATVNQFVCFGCGLCRTACKHGAIKLVDRMTFPSLVDVW